MPTNGTLKYKQDDGSIVELHPVGVDTEARTLATTEAARAKAAEQKLENDKADKSAIPDVSALVTKETYDAGQAAQDGRLDALENIHHYANIVEALICHGNIPCRVINAVYTLSGAICTFEQLVVQVQLEKDATIADTSITAHDIIGLSINYETADNKILNTANTLTKPASVDFIEVTFSLEIIFNNVSVYSETTDIRRIFNVFVSAK